MFDLFRSRAKAVRYLLGGLLMLVALSMVVTLIPGYGTGGGQQDQVLAEVGKEAVTAREVQQQMQAAMRNQRFRPEMAGYFAGQLIDEMISTRALVHEARRLGLEVTDAELARALRTGFPMLFPNGQFVGKDAYAAMLQQQGRTIPEFEEQLREQLLMGRLGNLVTDGVIVTPEDVEKEYRRRNDKVKLAYIAISPETLRTQATVTPEAIQSYFATAASEFQIPERRSFDLLIADEAGFGQRVNVSEADVRRAYDQNREQFRVPERVHVRHVLLKTSGKPKEEAPKLQARAAELLKELKGGADFAEIATKNSEDPVSAAKGGDLGWVARGQTVPAFESTAFSLKPNELSGIVTTEYGFHILQLIAKEDAHLKPFEEVKDQIGQEMKRQLVFETLQRSVDQAHDELVKQPLKAAEIAARYGLSLSHVDGIGPGQQIPAIGSAPEFSEAIAALSKGGVSQVVQVPGNKLVIAVVTGVQPSRPALLAEVEQQIRARLTSERASDLAAGRAAEAAEKLKASGGDIRKVAQQMGLEVKTTQEFGQDGAADGIGPGATLRAAFEQPVGGVFGPVMVESQRFLCKVESRTDADLSQLTPATRDELRAEIRQSKGKQQVELFMDSIRSALLRQGKIKIHKDVMNQVIATFRG